MICTLLLSAIQLHQQIMESQPATSTTTSTTTKQDNMPSSQSTSVDKTSTTSKTNPTLSIPNPASNPTEGSTSHAECGRTNRRATVNKTSGSMMKNEVEQSLPNQAKTLFAPVGIAEELARIQLILCEEIETEIQAVKRIHCCHPI